MAAETLPGHGFPSFRILEASDANKKRHPFVWRILNTNAPPFLDKGVQNHLGRAFDVFNYCRLLPIIKI